MNAVLENIRTRRSVRKYKPDMIPQEILDQILEAGTYAATGMGMQSPIILAVTNRELRDRLSAMNAKVMGTDSDPFYGAPVGNLMLAAHELGIASCWIHRAKEEFETPEGKEILASLGITGDYEGIGHCILGYADGPEPAAKPRKDSYVYYMK